jgi:hypothetical protein
MMKKHLASLGLAAALALTLGAPGAFAFSQSSAPGSIDLKSSNRIADPEDVMNDMAAPSSGGTHSYAFGNGTLQFGTPADSGSGVESRFAPNPSTVIVPSRH